MSALAVAVRLPDDLIAADLIDRARAYASQARAPATLRTYEAAWRGFTRWCGRRGVLALPAAPEAVAAWIADQGDRLRPATVKKCLAAISQAHKFAGHPSPVQTEPVRLVLQGLRRVKGTASAPKKALRVEHIKRMIATVPGGLVGVRDAAILLLGFVGGMRRSEIAALDVGDVAFEAEGAVVTIRRGKRDQEGVGRRVAVPVGRHEDTCPVRALRAWIEAAAIEHRALFVRLDRGAPRTRLSGKAIALVVKRAAARAGLDAALFSGHSLRRGFASEAARCGAAERDIARTTGHASLLVLRGYVEAGTLFQSCAARVLDL